MAFIDCPRCAGTGIYYNFGPCFRCRGLKKCRAIPVTKEGPRKPPGSLFSRLDGAAKFDRATDTFDVSSIPEGFGEYVAVNAHLRALAVRYNAGER